MRKERLRAQQDASRDGFAYIQGEQPMQGDQSTGFQGLTTLTNAVPWLQDILDAVPIPACVLNAAGKVLQLNRHYSQLFGLGAAGSGLRFGDLIGCVNAKRGPSGCGSSPQCKTCGATASIVASLLNRGRSTHRFQWCHETPNGIEQSEQIVVCTPLRIGEEDFLIFAMMDVGAAPQCPCSVEEAPIMPGFAVTGREGLATLEGLLTLLREIPLLQELIDAMPAAISIINTKGQVVLLNHQTSQAFGVSSACGLGKRPGELIGCVSAKIGPDGCGTSLYCKRCGAAASIVASQMHHGQAVRQLHLRRETPEGIQEADLIVTATPLRVANENFTILSMIDLDPIRAEAALQA